MDIIVSEVLLNGTPVTSFETSRSLIYVTDTVLCSSSLPLCPPPPTEDLKFPGGGRDSVIVEGWSFNPFTPKGSPFDE